MQHSGQQAPTMAGGKCKPADPSCLRHRSLGKLPRAGQHMSWSIEMVERLGQEACLKGHRGCVNCLEWNRKGDLLASGSDDGNVIIWDAFRRKKQHVVQTGHDSPIFSVKFIPNSSDIDVATCASNKIRVIDSIHHRILLNCDQCHTGRVKRLAVHPDGPSLIWSAAEDGRILEYDTRLNHVCNTRSSNTLVDLRTISPKLRAKCIAVNPTRSEMLAVGSDDACIRLLDRRYIKLFDLNSNKKTDTSWLTYYAPGHLLTTPRCNNIQSHGVTYLTFNSRGTELLASYHGEQVYLFNIRKHRDHYQSFDKSIKPLLLGKSHRGAQTPAEPSLTKRMKSCKLDAKENLSVRARLLVNLDECNEEISEAGASPTPYRMRSKLLFERDWKGDKYQALRDLCDALSINPMSARTIHQLAEFYKCEEDIESADSLFQFLQLHHYDYMSEFQMEMICKLLADYRRDAISRRSSSPFENRYGRSNDHEGSIYPSVKRPNNSNVSDYAQRFCGHCNMNTDIQEANFFGLNDEYIVSGSDDGAFYLWDKKTTSIVKAVDADNYNVNCVQPHPNIPLLATSGVESSVKLWSPIGSICCDVVPLVERFYQNQEFIKTDPLDMMFRELNQQGIPNQQIVAPLPLRRTRMNHDDEHDHDHSWGW